jgi:hypothetical protein
VHQESSSLGAGTIRSRGDPAGALQIRLCDFVRIRL